MNWGSIFPGQGSQHPGMGKFLFDNFNEAKLRFEEASDALNLNFKKLCFEGSEEELQLTKNTQPALLLVSTISFEVVKKNTGFKSIASAGHSIGEYAALVTSNALGFTEALLAVRSRGEAMQTAVPLGEGAMCAVLGMTETQVRETCKWAEANSGFKPIEPANFNSPDQVVISGSAKAMDWLRENYKNAVSTNPELSHLPSRAKFIPLKVSAPFHCSMMKPAEDIMRAVLEKINFKNIEYPVIQNYNAKPTLAASELRENIIRQISSPVLWTQCVESIRDIGALNLVEFGSGKILAGLVKKIDSEKLKTFNLNSLEDFKLLEIELNKH